MRASFPPPRPPFGSTADLLAVLTPLSAARPCSCSSPAVYAPASPPSRASASWARWAVGVGVLYQCAVAWVFALIVRLSSGWR